MGLESVLLNTDGFQIVFHCMLAISAGYSSMWGGPDNSEETLMCLSNTYHCINQDLHRNSKPSDSTVAAVMSIAIHEDLLGQSGRSEIHINALSRMVNIRGGLGGFEENKFLTQKICRYVYASLYKLANQD
jgi:hypothetical protein